LAKVKALCDSEHGRAREETRRSATLDLRSEAVGGVQMQRLAREPHREHAPSRWIALTDSDQHSIRLYSKELLPCRRKPHGGAG